MVEDMSRRYPKYQAGGMPSGMPTDIQRLIRRMLEARTDRAEDVIPDMADGGIIGLQTGGPVRPHRRYRAGPEKLGEHAEEWRRKLEMDVLTGRKPSSEHPTIQFGGIYGSRAKP